jgi:hypothetical protein
MRLWPPLLWPMMSFASLLILMGLGPWDPVALTIGVGLAVAVFAASLYIATRRMRDRPRPSGFGWVIAAVTAFYAVATAVPPRSVRRMRSPRWSRGSSRSLLS